MKTKVHYVTKPEASREFLDGMAVLRMCGHVSRTVYLEALGHMEDKWPDRGWLKAAIDLEKWYYDHEVPADGRNERIQFNNVVSIRPK